MLGRAEIIMNEATKLNLDSTCYTKGMDNIKIKFPSISAEDAEYISIYGCFCALKVAQKGTIRVVAADFRNVPYCVDYAVLRNSMRFGGTGIKEKCISSYPHNTGDDSKNADIADFCSCAVLQAQKIESEITSLKLNEEQIFDKLVPLVKGCRYNI
jgi:hypothetical protein